jgi:SNF2 family DNA or RNA helicase
VRIYDDAMAFIADIRDGTKRRARLKRRFDAKHGAAAFRRLLKVPLYAYQKDGALFAAMAGRAIIADEMGLGKTIQAVAAAEILAQDGGVERVLINGPTKSKSSPNAARWSSKGRLTPAERSMPKRHFSRSSITT